MSNLQRNAQIADDQCLVYWTNLGGEIMIAPDTRMKPFLGWMRFEAKTRSEIESVSRRMAAQEYDKFRGMKVEEHLRSKAKREAIAANCRLRLARGCVSAADEQITRNTLKSLEAKDSMLYKLLTEEPDLSRGSLMIEKYDNEKVQSLTVSKQRGLQDSEVSTIASLAEMTN